MKSSQQKTARILSFFSLPFLLFALGIWYFELNKAPVITEPGEASVEILAFDPKLGSDPLPIGMGFFIDDKGTVLTSEHVVGDPNRQYRAKFMDGRLGIVTEISSYPEQDVATLVVRSSDEEVLTDLPYFTFSESDAVVGSTVYYGKERGLIVAVDQSLTAGKLHISKSLDKLIETDLILKSGNSGAAITNEKGQVIGMLAAIDKEGGHSFLIPSTELLKAINLSIY